MSKIPDLLNPVKVSVEKLNKTDTKFNNRLRENVNIIRRAAVKKIDAQVVWRRSSVGGSKDDPNFEGQANFGLAGVTEDSEGYFIVRYRDLTSGGFTIERGDKIIKMGQIDTEYYVLSTRPAAHYPDQGGFTLLMVFFKDRNP